MRRNARAFGGCGELHPDDLFGHIFATGERAETTIRSGASIWRTMPALWIARYSLDSAFARAVR
jgi:hypothetical protein